jgi:hypothetical protein
MGDADMPPPLTVSYSVSLPNATAADARRLVESLRGCAAGLGFLRVGGVAVFDDTDAASRRVWFDAALPDGANATVGLACETAVGAGGSPGDRPGWSWSGVVRTGHVRVLSKLLAAAAQAGGTATLSFAGRLVSYGPDAAGGVRYESAWVVDPDDG